MSNPKPSLTKHQALLNDMVFGQNPLKVLWGQIKTNLQNMILVKRNLDTAKQQAQLMNQKLARLEALVDAPNKTTTGDRINYLR